MTDENARHGLGSEQNDADEEAEHARNLELAKKFAERDKDYVPSERSRQIIERLQKNAEEMKKRPAMPRSQPDKYDFAPGIAPDGHQYPVHEHKPRKTHKEDSTRDDRTDSDS